jgi:hypothetical protein
LGPLSDSGRLRCPREEAGDKAVGVLPEGQVNFLFELSEGSGILRQSVGPRLLLDRKMLLDLSQSVGRCRDVWSGLGVESESHAKSFRVKQLLLR